MKIGYIFILKYIKERVTLFASLISPFFSSEPSSSIVERLMDGDK